MTLSKDARQVYKSKAGQSLLNDLMKGRELSPESKKASMALKHLQDKERDASQKSGYRRLTPSEIEALKQDCRDTLAEARRLLAADNQGQ